MAELNEKELNEITGGTEEEKKVGIDIHTGLVPCSICGTMKAPNQACPTCSSK